MKEEVMDAYRSIENSSDTELEDIFKYQYAEMTPQLTEQLEEYRAFLKERSRMANSINNVQAVQQALQNEMALDPTVVVYGEDVGYEGGVFRATVGLQEEFGKSRSFDTPLAESAIVGTAVGMAINGFKPVVEMQFMGFIYPAVNQIVSHVSRYRNRTRGQRSMPIVIRAPYGGGIRALEHHSESTEAMFAHIPGLKVVIPSTPYDTKGLLIAAIRDPDPILFLEPKRIYRAFRQEVPEEAYELPIGKAKIVQEGDDITIVAWGAMMPEVQKAVESLEDISRNHRPSDHQSDGSKPLWRRCKTGRILVVLTKRPRVV